MPRERYMGAGELKHQTEKFLRKSRSDIDRMKLSNAEAERNIRHFLAHLALLDDRKDNPLDPGN